MRANTALRDLRRCDHRAGEVQGLANHVASLIDMALWLGRASEKGLVYIKFSA